MPWRAAMASSASDVAELTPQVYRQGCRSCGRVMAASTGRVHVVA